jgi:hypothetical protein
MTDIDTDISHYTISEMLQILDMDDLDELDENEIIEKTNGYIDNRATNPQLSLFFQEMQNQLLQYMNSSSSQEQNADNTQIYPILEKQTTAWNTTQVLQQSDPNQQSKITDRTQKIDVYNNSQFPMKREQLGINNNFNVDVAQDSLNPNLENKTSRFINLDSQYRQPAAIADNSATDYTLDLSDPLTNVLNMRLYSYQIPFTWYTIDPAYENTCFWINIDPTLEPIAITIEAGNYTPSEFVAALNAAFRVAGFFFDPTGIQPVSYNSKNGKITINLNIDHDSLETFTENSSIIFYDYSASVQCSKSCLNISHYINQTLGWIMGYRLPEIMLSIISTTNEIVPLVAPAILDLIGTKYIILVLDDYNQNHINNGLVTITETSKTLKMPSYYSPDLPYTCSRALSRALSSALSQDINTQQTQANNPNLLVTDKLMPNYTLYPEMLPSAPRILTQSQIYTINEIVKNNETNTNYRTKAPTNTDVFAILPIKPSGASIGDLLVEFSGSLQDNKRTYFGPVNIDRMRIKLVNDKGNVMNLNGADWSITIIAELLYQY